MAVHITFTQRYAVGLPESMSQRWLTGQSAVEVQKPARVSHLWVSELHACAGPHSVEVVQKPLRLTQRRLGTSHTCHEPHSVDEPHRPRLASHR